MFSSFFYVLSSTCKIHAYPKYLEISKNNPPLSGYYFHEKRGTSSFNIEFVISIICVVTNNDTIIFLKTEIFVCFNVLSSTFQIYAYPKYLEIFEKSPPLTGYYFNERLKINRFIFHK